MLEDLTPPVREHTCKVRTIAKGLSDTDRGIFLEAVDNPVWGFKTLSNELSKRGIVLTDSGIAKHRRLQCSCFRS
jgi:hypothetical protein